MRIAIIDCGTNTFHLLIAETQQDGKFTMLLKENISVKLGESGITNRIISEAPFERGINTLKNFSEIIHKNKPNKVYAFATAAIRKATNGIDFVKRAQEATGIEIEMIDGQKEAELIYLGVKQAVKLTDEKVLIIDIGGGSVEFIIANENEISWKHSFEIGAAILLEKFMPSDPITVSEINEIELFLEKELQPLFVQLQTSNLLVPIPSGKLQTLIGSSGSFETFVDLIAGRFSSARVNDMKTEYEIGCNEFLSIHEQLIDSTSVQRMQMKGMIEMRVDMIVMASVLVNFVLEKTGITKMKLSTFALKEGILFEVLKAEKK